MLELIAQGNTVDARWRRQLPTQRIEIGRATQAYRVPWDSQVSRRHVVLSPADGGVRVEKIAEASNPVFFNGKQSDSFILTPGEHFVIGQTTFSLTADRAFVSLDAPSPISQRTFSHEFLDQIPYRNADRRIEVLNRIPEVISSAGNEEDLLIRMVNTLMAGISMASTIGIVQLHVIPEVENAASDVVSEAVNEGDSKTAIRIIQWDRRGFDGGDFQPSERLIRQAIEADQTTLHIFNQRQRTKGGVSAEYTFDYENDWAFACPINGDASPGWSIYVAGSNLAGGSSLDTGSGESDLQDDVKFCELVGSTLKNLLLVKQLERQQSSLRSFFSPIVMDAISGRDPDEVLSPRKCDVSVLFCDLRGFSRKSEQMADNLLVLLARVSDSLGIMTHKILEHGGVIGDFHGDSAMGFWGWPIEPADGSENAQSAIMAALQIQQAVVVQLKTTPSLENFQIGLGIASGEAVAGKIGTSDQVKVTAFGPVVNLAARLEGMSKWFGSCILVDGETVGQVKPEFLKKGEVITRRLGKIQPFGLESSFDIYQLATKGEIPTDVLAGYDQALSEFEAGDLESAKQTLSPLMLGDEPSMFLADFIIGQQGKSHGQEKGIIRMQAK